MSIAMARKNEFLFWTRKGYPFLSPCPDLPTNIQRSQNELDLLLRAELRGDLLASSLPLQDMVFIETKR